MSRSDLIHGSSLLLSELSSYNRWLAAQLNRLGPLEGVVLEFGCGSGGVTRALSVLPGVRRLIANDISPQVKSYFKEHFAAAANIEFSDANIFTDPQTFAAMSYDWVVTSNTLEHIEYDSGALRRIVECARTRTGVVLVPAFACLYGTCDRDGGHLRRYTKASFRRMAEASGLRVERIFYFNMIGALAWWLQYVLLRRDDYTTAAHARSYSMFNRLIVPVYSKVERFMPCPFGLSVVARVTPADRQG
jgi:SAM-dependent methyltransferase